MIGYGTDTALCGAFIRKYGQIRGAEVFFHFRIPYVLRINEESGGIARLGNEFIVFLERAVWLSCDYEPVSRVKQSHGTYQHIKPFVFAYQPEEQQGAASLYVGYSEQILRLALAYGLAEMRVCRVRYGRVRDILSQGHKVLRDLIT